MCIRDSLNTSRIGFTRTLERMGADVSVRHAGAAGKEPYGMIAACHTPSPVSYTHLDVYKRQAERRLYKLEQELGEDPTEQQLAAAGRARDAYEVLGGYTIEAKVRSVMFGLGFADGDLRRLTTEFSGGWQRRCV